MCPMLRRIRTAPLDTSLADLLQKHVGNDPQEAHCQEAYLALLARVNGDFLRDYVRLIKALGGEQITWCSLIKGAINVLRDAEALAALSGDER